MSPFSPFSKEELIPQEEMLEIKKQKGELFIGLPKETHFQEKRVCLTPDAVASLVSQGHRILIEANAGNASGFTDRDYSEAGAEITSDTKKVFSCPIILKIEPPSLAEIALINPQTLLISALQIYPLVLFRFKVIFGITLMLLPAPILMQVNKLLNKIFKTTPFVIVD